MALTAHIRKLMTQNLLRLKNPALWKTHPFVRNAHVFLKTK